MSRGPEDRLVTAAAVTPPGWTAARTTPAASSPGTTKHGPGQVTRYQAGRQHGGHQGEASRQLAMLDPGDLGYSDTASVTGKA